LSAATPDMLAGIGLSGSSGLSGPAGGAGSGAGFGAGLGSAGTAAIDHHRKMREEEERLRDEVRQKQDKLRRSLRMWDRLERESKSFELKSDLSERSLRGLVSGEIGVASNGNGVGGGGGF